MLNKEKAGRKEEVKQVAQTAAVAASIATTPQTRSIMRFVLIILIELLAVAGLILAFYTLRSVLLLVVLSIFFAYLIAPLVQILRRPFTIRGREQPMPRALAIGIVYLAIFGSLALTIYLLTPVLSQQLGEFWEQAPTYLTNARARANGLNEIYGRLNLPPAVRATANAAVTRMLDEAGRALTGQGFQGALYLLGYIPWLILVPILGFFLLKDAESFRDSALKMLPRGRMRWRGDEFFQDVNNTLAAYIRAQLIACLLIGTICTIGFTLLGVNYGLVLGVVAGMLEFIPLVGPLLVAVIAVLLAGFESSTLAVGVLLFLGALRIVQDYVLYPRLIGSGIHLHPLAVILAILCGHELAGVAGIFLAIPVIAIITVTYRHWLEHRGSEGLVADLLKPALPAPDALQPSGATLPTGTTPATGAASATSATPAAPNGEQIPAPVPLKQTTTPTAVPQPSATDA